MLNLSHRGQLSLFGVVAGLLTLPLNGRDNQFPQEKLSYERYIAVDNACGWPLLTCLPSGKIALLVWPAPNHGLTEGAVECWISADDGRHWTKTGIPVPNVPKESRLNHAGGVTPGGDLLVLVGGAGNKHPQGWTPSPSDPPRPKSQSGPPLLDPIPAISRDEGRTWQRYGKISGSGRLPGISNIPFGQIASVGDGTLGAMLYDYNEVNGDCRDYFFVTQDNGATWTKRSQLSQERNANESTWIRLKNGDLYAAARGGGDEHIDGYRSSDHGASWTYEQALTLPQQHPGSLATLPDGRILLTYGVRNPGRWAIDARIGDPTAHTWTAPILVADLAGSTDGQGPPSPVRDGGYPSSVVLHDGTILTAYYCRGIPTHRRYHVGVVRWQPPAD